jgi:hypothetical protein
MLNNTNCSDGYFKKAVKYFASSPRKRVLLIDEIDVFFNTEFFGKYYTPSTSIKNQCIQELATFVWKNRSKISSHNVILKSS